MEKLNSELDKLINYINNTKEYKLCIKLKKQMDGNDEVKKLISEVKKLQKKYIKSDYDDSIKKELEKKNEELSSIPIYVTYNQTLEKVNEMLEYVKDNLNDYFDNLLN